MLKNNKLILKIVPFLIAFTLVFILMSKQDKHLDYLQQEKVNKKPNDWLFRQRAYPYNSIDSKAYQKASKYRKEQLSIRDNQSNNNFLKNIKWEFAGPTNVGGRVTDIEITSSDPSIIYVGTASGGIFKSTDIGKSWSPIFDDEISLSIGDIALAPSNEDIIYVGVGEPNAGGGSVAYDGNGIYKSTDGGNTWENLGLKNTGSIGKVLVSPNDPEICFVGAMGHLFNNNDNRGVFKTTDGGNTWEKVLYINDSTGIIDMAINPNNPKIVFAAAWERVRRVDRRSYGGYSSAIYRSMDGGDNWIKLSNGLPLSSGRIGIAISKSNPDVLYSIHVDENSGKLKGLFKSKNGGDSWFSINRNKINDVPYMWWFGKISVDPNDDNLVYVQGFKMHKSIDGGSNWATIFSGSHVDQHSIAINPKNKDFLIAGNDGGVYISNDGGHSYTKSNSLPVTQFYTCEIDNSLPARLYGGVQDNGTIRTNTGAINDWQRIFGGDGFKVLVDPNDNNFIYAEYQYGGFYRSTDGGISFNNGSIGIHYSDRSNWNTPVIFNPSNSNQLFLGTNKLYLSIDRAQSWTPISPDLTTNPKQNNLVYGTITTISVSPIKNEIIYVGTDDGLVQVTNNAGNSWKIISKNLPNRWVTNVTSDPVDFKSAYVTFSGYRYGSNRGHIFKTIDFGNNWIDISGDLPDIPINDFVKTPLDGNLYIATDIGVFYSINEGINWNLLGLGIPNVIITDILFHSDSNILIAATYGRGMYKISLKYINGVSIPQEKIASIKVFPNPFKNHLEINFEVINSDRYAVLIYNLEGEKVKSIYNGHLNSGNHVFEYNTTALPPGIYFCIIKSENQSIKKRIRLIKN